MRFGHSDPRVRAIGEQVANEAAAGPAASDAEDAVRRSFMDLTHEPSRNGAIGLGRGRMPPPMRGPFAAEPILDDVFAAYPLTRAPGLSRDGRHAIEEWRVAPTLFARDDRATRAYDAKWKDPAFAFAVWRERQGRGSHWARLGGGDRERFRAMFSDRFEEVLESIDSRFTREAFYSGFADGWRYGAPVAAEWAFRRGYAEGFDMGVIDTAAIAFRYAYPRAFEAAYDRSFDAWSRSVHAGLGEVQLTDENGDGIFEPGERVLIRVAVVNYGGGSGVYDLNASGSEFSGPADATLRLSGRGLVPDGERLALRVKDGVPPRTRTAVTVAIADAHADAPVYVSRPLEIDGLPKIDTDRIGGRVTVSLAVRNTSRHDARAFVRVDSSAGAGGAHHDDLGVIPAGGKRSASLTFSGIHPLDLIGAESRWTAFVSRDDTINDVNEVRMAPVATDLSNPDLMDFMVGLARAPDVSPSDVREARALMIERLRADWDRAVDASGNPYKSDFESEGARTALGELVRVTQGGVRSFASPQVFEGLEGAVAELADDLPGAHPLLRKWMKKLAARLG